MSAAALNNAATALHARLAYKLCPLLAGLRFATEARRVLDDLQEALACEPKGSPVADWVAKNLSAPFDVFANGGSDSAGAVIDGLARLARDMAEELAREADEIASAARRL